MAGQEDDIPGPDAPDDDRTGSSGSFLEDFVRDRTAQRVKDAQDELLEKDKEGLAQAQAGISHKGPFQNVDQIGQKFSQRLMERLGQPVEESQAFFYGSKAIRDSLSIQSATARQRLGDSAVAGGFMGSGAVQQGGLDIARGESFAFSQGIQELFLQLEDRREQDVLSFLSAASGRELTFAQQKLDKRGQNMALAGATIGAIGNAVP